MAPLHSLSKALLLLSLISSTIPAFSQSHELSGSTTLLEGSEVQPVSISNNKTNSTKVSASPKNQTKLKNPSITTFKNQTKGMSDIANNKTTSKASITASSAKINSTTSKPSSNSTSKFNSIPKQNSSDLHKNKTVTSNVTKSKPSKSVGEPKPKSSIKTQIDLEDEEEDLISHFRDLPYKFHETLVPDLERISKTSRLYLTNYNEEITKGFKPYVGNKYAPAIGSIISFAFIIVPLILGSLIFDKITAHFSIQKILIFIQIYLCIYFTILCLSSMVTGVEPLKFFFSSSQSTYVCVQVLQTLAYVLYLLLQLMYLVLLFCTETGLVTKLLGLAQTILGFEVGLHYYITVFHKAVMRQPPKTGWKVHAVYATCFVVICLLGKMDSRKKAYFEEGGDEGKQN